MTEQPTVPSVVKSWCLLLFVVGYAWMGDRCKPSTLWSSWRVGGDPSCDCYRCLKNITNSLISFDMEQAMQPRTSLSGGCQPHIALHTQCGACWYWIGILTSVLYGW